MILTYKILRGITCGAERGIVKLFKFQESPIENTSRIRFVKTWVMMTDGKKVSVILKFKFIPVSFSEVCQFVLVHKNTSS